MRYGAGPEVLRNLSFELKPGSFHFLTGASGAGKSTLLKLMYLAHRPTRGVITLFDRNAAALDRDELPEVRRRVGVVFQEFRLLDHLSTFDNVALPLRVNHVEETLVKRHVSELLNWVGLEDQQNAAPPTLSGGQKQRAAIARAVIGRPDLLLADEPTGNVDDAIAVRLLYLFEELHRMGATVVIATHNRSLVERFGHPVMRLRDGGLTVEDRPDWPDSETGPAARPGTQQKARQADAGGQARTFRRSIEDALGQSR